MFIVFEGIDGSGKTTLSGRVTEALAAHGISVYQARPKGLLRSKLAGDIRDLARDPRGLAMSAHTELFLFLARDAQMIDSIMRPALGAAEVVFADRYLYSAITLSTARGELPARDIQVAAEIVARGLWPDLVIYCDVDIFTSNTRKRIERILNPRAPWDFGRKGLGGLGVRRRIREAYLALAAADPQRWFVVDNANSTIDENVALITRRILAALGRTVPPGETIVHAAPATGISGTPGWEAQDREAFYRCLNELADRGQGRLAAYHVRSLVSDEAWSLRERLCDAQPALIAVGLEPLGCERAIALRERLVNTAPQQVARSFGAWADTHPKAFELRRSLVAAFPEEIAMSLAHIDSDEAFALRDVLINEVPAAVLASLKTLDSERAWELRDKCGKKKHDWGLLQGLAGLDHERAWRLREKFLERAAPWVILSLEGCESARSYELRCAFFAHAPKLVINSLAGISSDEAWALRRDAAPSCREALTSLKNDNSDEAWELRRDFCATWPSFAAQSVGPLLGLREQSRRFLGDLVAAHPNDLDVAHYYVKAIDALQQEV